MAQAEEHQENSQDVQATGEAGQAHKWRQDGAQNAFVNKDGEEERGQGEWEASSHWLDFKRLFTIIAFTEGFWKSVGSSGSKKCKTHRYLSS